MEDNVSQTGTSSKAVETGGILFGQVGKDQIHFN